jgi:hypothetical protein
VATGPRNPFLADSSYAMAHGRCDQQDNVSWRGPEGPGEVLGGDDIQYAWLGPGHFGGIISSPYPDGRRIVWSNGRQNIVKLDYETLEVLADHEIVGGEGRTPIAELEECLVGLDELEGWDAVEHAIDLSMRFMTGLEDPGTGSLGQARSHRGNVCRHEHDVRRPPRDVNRPRLDRRVGSRLQ